MIKIKRENLRALFDKISDDMPLFMPLKSGEQVNFGYYEKGAQFDIDRLKTARSPKNVFFPQSENMMKFKREGKSLSIEDVREEKEPYLVFGVKACDYKAFSVLDNVFLQEPVDTYYKARRDAGIIFTLSCNDPENSCFCKAFGIDASAPGGDGTCSVIGDYLYMTALTEKGEKVLALAEEFAEKADKADEEKVEKNKEEIKVKIAKLPYSDLDLSRFKPENLNELFNLPVWNELSEACLGCGACTFVCPTCQCFDIRDFETNKDIIRFRCWDSCMYSDFTQMAAANSRTTQMQRYRQRFMHKLVYYPSQYGMYSCVGCGRCVNKCPQHLNIIKVVKKIGGENK